MKTKILAAALVCLSVGVLAQQSNSGQKPSSKSSAVTAPRDAATGMATGKKMAHDDWQATTAASSNNQNNGASGDANAGQATTVRESPSKASLGVRESPSKPSSNLRESPTKQTTQVSVGDVNGDGMPDKAAASPSNPSGQNAAINNSHSNIKSPRDIATGQASGKRQHQPLSLTKTSEAAAKK